MPVILAVSAIGVGSSGGSSHGPGTAAGTTARGGGGDGEGGGSEGGGGGSVAKKPNQTSPKLERARILSKPKPIYTPQAKAEGIEGEVVLRVMFSADGRVRVLNVLRGLGHGLDEAAIHSVTEIKFLPATLAGAPQDSVATLHVIYRLGDST